MLIERDREKLLNAIVFFSKNTAKCGKTKLYKLLFLLDFEHFRQAGRSVTGMEYYAWKLGPVPTTLHEELDDPEPDLSERIAVTKESEFDLTRETIVPIREFDEAHFSRRELRLMSEIAERFRAHTAKEMVDVTHAENAAWDKVWRGGEGRSQLIPYELVLSDEEREGIMELAAEHEEMKANFR
jgi:uncharacterized phage-associated protein